MGHTVVTMTRGDASRIGEWVGYHSRLGFDDFQVVLDGDVDGTADVLRSLAVADRITLHPRDEVGEYFDRLDNRGRHDRAVAWRERHAAELASGELRGQDPLAWRQHLHLPGVLAPYVAGHRGRGWLALIDVDEFVVLTGDEAIGDVTGTATAPRLRLLSYDVDTTGHDPHRPVLQQHTMRWAHEDLLAHPDPRWSRRVKSLVRYRCASLEASVHKISRGKHQVLDPGRARLHHFRVPNQDLGIPYTVADPVTFPG